MTYLTPPAAAKRYSIKPSTIINRIRSGELEAIDVARPGASRPRYRISEAALERWEQRLAVVPRPKPIRRRRRDAAVKSFV